MILDNTGIWQLFIISLIFNIQRYNLRFINDLNKLNQKEREEKNVYSVLNEEPQEQDFVTFGLLILKPEPIRLSI